MALAGTYDMQNALQQRLIDRWPNWFVAGGDVRRTSMSLGFAHGDGWFDLVWRLCEQLEPLVVMLEKQTGSSFEVLQVKEKFGSLRFYTNFDNEAIRAVISAAELESSSTCEVCGDPGIRQGGIWIQTLCEAHNLPNENRDSPRI